MSFKILTIMTLLLASVNALANEVAPHGSAAGAAQALRITNTYTQHWIAFPPLRVRSMQGSDAEAQTLPLKKGRVLMVVFLASWCIPCQQLMPDLKRLAVKYQSKYSDLIYVFAHDTEPDAKAFASYHKIASGAYLGTAKVLEDYHQPDLPALYIADRYGWLVYRKLDLKTQDLAEVETLLDLHTSL